MSHLGVVCGLAAEARCLDRLEVDAVCSAGSSRRARARAEQLVAGGAPGLVSFGLAGGLESALQPGDLILASAVVVPGGGHIATDAAWRARLLATLEGASVHARVGLVAGSERLAATLDVKQALRAATGGAVVDMESHVVAEVASAAGLPFLVIRAIADPCHRAIPALATDALAPDGRIRAGAVGRRLLGRPADLLPLIRLGRDSGRALATLRRVARFGAPALAFR